MLFTMDVEEYMERVEAQEAGEENIVTRRGYALALLETGMSAEEVANATNYSEYEVELLRETASLGW